MAIDGRRLRSLVLIGAAMVVVVAASLAYLRPPAAVHVAPATKALGVTWTEPQLVQNINLVDANGGSVLVWNRAPSGGHAG